MIEFVGAGDHSGATTTIGPRTIRSLDQAEVRRHRATWMWGTGTDEPQILSSTIPV